MKNLSSILRANFAKVKEDILDLVKFRSKKIFIYEILLVHVPQKTNCYNNCILIKTKFSSCECILLMNSSFESITQFCFGH